MEHSDDDDDTSSRKEGGEHLNNSPQRAEKSGLVNDNDFENVQWILLKYKRK